MVTKILLVLGAALAALLAFGLHRASALRTIRIERSVEIQGSVQEVFELVGYLKNFPRWSPFLAQDPTQKYEVKGADGRVGAQYHWTGNQGKDLGYQEIVALDPLASIGLRCFIQKPFVAQPTFDYTFRPSGAGVEVRQVFKLESGLVDAFFLWAFGVKAKMEQTNEQGLRLLKKAAEAK